MQKSGRTNQDAMRHQPLQVFLVDVRCRARGERERERERRAYMLICMRMHHVACVHISDAIAFAGDYYEMVVHEETCGLMVL